MLRVRFPNGQCIQYNDATCINIDAHGGTEILRRDKATGQNFWVAYLPEGTHALVEWVQPCAISNPIARELSPDSALELVKRHLRTLPGHKVKALKLELANFNARRCAWRT
jgi:hypothetical protein